MNHKSKTADWVKYLAISLFIFIISSCIDDRAPLEPTEIDRPSQTGISPNEGELAFPLNGIISIEFDEPMDISSFDGRLVLTDSDSNLISGTFSKDGFFVNFTPSSSLNKATIYNASLRGGIKDENRNTIQIAGDPVYSDTIEIANTWFFSEGDYSDGGYFNVYLRDRKQGKIYTFKNLAELGTEITSLSAPDGIMISTDGKKMLITNTSKNEVIIIDLLTYEQLSTLSLAQTPTNIVVNANLAYVISVNGRQLTIINTDNNSIVSKNDLTFFPGKLAISSDGTILYTFDQVTLDLVLLNTANVQILKRISKTITGGISGELTFNSETEQLYICDSRGRTVRVIDKQGNQLTDYFTTPGGSEPVQILSGQNSFILASGKTLYKLDKENTKIIDEKLFGSNIKSIAIIPSGDIVYVTLNSSVLILDYKTFTILSEIDLGVTGLESILASPIRF